MSAPGGLGGDPEQAERAERRWDDVGVADLAAIRAFVREATRRDGADEEAVADLVQAVDKLVCNVVEHGYGKERGPVTVRRRP